MIVDEFQDTNILQWSILQDIVGREEESPNSLYIFGDRHQKIYEFIGAMQGIMDKAKTDYGMQEILLKTNHRFKHNQTLLKFDAHIRAISQNPHDIHIDEIASIDVVGLRTQDDEAKYLVELVQSLLEQDPESTIAVLFRAGKVNRNTKRIVEYFTEKKSDDFSYFFALYSDEDSEYVDFHQKCLSSLYANLITCRNFHTLRDVLKEDLQVTSPSETWESLQILLETFLFHLTKEYRFLSFDEKVELLIDTFRNSALKQYLMYVTLSRLCFQRFMVLKV